jgi:pyruvate kinase
MAIITDIELLINRRTKIVATVGPASSSANILEALIRAGVNVFRLNMSHGDHNGHKAVYENIRSISDRLKCPVAVLADLCGPKIRTGKFPDGGLDLVDGSEVIITTDQAVVSEGMIYSQYKALAADVKSGDRILLADGLFELRVISSRTSKVRCEVIHGGWLTDNKGMNLPGVKMSAPCMTPKDIKDAEFSISLGVDFIALSFVRTADDVLQLQELVAAAENVPDIIAKIEKPEALENAEDILEVADAIMVARGDLGVELSPEEVPIAQSKLIDMARYLGKPVIVATQMLESMINHSRPTRAEVTDISYAVTSGADALMLSAETAVGNFPVESVEMMDRVSRQSEAHLWSSGAWGKPLTTHESKNVWNTVSAATAQMSKQLDVQAVIVVTQSGISAQTISAARPVAPIIVLTGSRRAYNKLSLLWGVVPLYNDQAGKANPNELARQIAVDLGLASTGQFILLVRGFNDDPGLNLPSVTAITI